MPLAHRRYLENFPLVVVTTPLVEAPSFVFRVAEMVELFKIVVWGAPTFPTVKTRRFDVHTQAFRTNELVFDIRVPAKTAT